jgi:undecaprenyl-diphosphatase
MTRRPLQEYPVTEPTPTRRTRGLLRPLLRALGALVLAIGFAVLGTEIQEGETQAFDTTLLQHAMAIRAAHPGFSAAMRDLSGVGSTTVLTFLTVATCGYLYLSRRRISALLVALSIGSAALLVGTLKALFGRARPDASYAELVQHGLSFPSGHASMSAVVFLTLGALVAGTHARVVERLYILATAAVLALAVGVSRIALGVHWATDVLGGWAFGTAWAVFWLLVAAHWPDRPRTDSRAPIEEAAPPAGGDGAHPERGPAPRIR